MNYICPKCNKAFENVKIPRCLNCDNVYNLEYKYNISNFIKNLQKPITHWKYMDLMPINSKNIKVITMGEGNTPLIYKNGGHFKCEYMNPTGSFKDRASALEVTLAQGYNEIIVASTGNMGVSLATYAAFVGMHCKIFMPKSINNNKIDHMKMCGSEIIEIEGDYTNAMIAAEQYYLDHPNSYLAGDYGVRVEGTKSVGFEIADQLNWNVPDYIIVPVGNGILLWSIYKAFKDLNDIGIINGMPKIIGVKSNDPEQTIASAIACPKPNAEYIVSKIAYKIIEVSDYEIMNARETLAKNGFFVEPGGATAFAGLDKVNIEGDIIVLLTGTGKNGV